MKNTLKQAVILTSLIVYFYPSIKSQNFYGLQNSNYSGVHAIYINPAGIADAGYSSHLSLFCFGSNASTNFATFEPPFTLKDLIKGNSNVPKDSAGNTKWDPSWMKQNLDGKPKNLYLGLEFRGPGYMTQIGKKFAIAIATRTRSSLQINNVSEEFASYVKAQIDSSAASFQNIKNNTFAMNLNSYQEFSFSGAMVLLNHKSLYLKAGATAKYLLGLGSAYFTNSAMDFTTKPNDTVVFNKTDLQMGYTNIDIFNRIKNGSISAALPSFKQISGGGFGFDFGAIFEWRPKITEKLAGAGKYLVKGGISLLDWGKITYGTKVKSFTANNSTPVTFTEKDAFSNAFNQGIDSGLAYVENYAKANFNYTKGDSKYKVNIPTTLNIQLDWNVLKWFYVGLNWSQSVITKKDIALRRPSSVVVIPRFESKLIEVGVPIAVYNDYSVFGMGAYLRIGPAFIGTDNLVQSINKNQFNGFDFYFGVCFGIPNRKAKSTGSEGK